MITKLKVPGYYDGEYSESNILEVVEKLNQIIDYLSDREASLDKRVEELLKDPIRFNHAVKKEASKGEDKEYPYHLYNDKTGEIDSHVCKVSPPQQEESIKECRCPKCKLENNHGVCDDHNCCNYNPKVKEESRGEWYCDCHNQVVDYHNGVEGTNSFVCSVTKKSCDAHIPQLKEESHKEDECEVCHDIGGHLFGCKKLLKMLRKLPAKPEQDDEWKNELHEKSENGVLPVYFITEYIPKHFVSKVKINRAIEQQQKIDGMYSLNSLSLLKKLGLEEL